MLNLKVIGVGAAGNKAVCSLVEKYNFSQNNITLVNSTMKDIPEKYKDRSIIFGLSSERLGGCGKERNIGKSLILDDMRMGRISFDNLVDPDTHCVIIATSTEGGTGSAATPIISKYIRDVLGVPVIACLFFGFNSDVRGMQNSIEICQELPENIGVVGISNYKCIGDSYNKPAAEAEANDQFCKIVRILSGQDLVPSEQNIDDTDLFKLVTTPGYMMVGAAAISKLRNIGQFNQAISDAIDSSRLIDVKGKGAKRIGVIFTAHKRDYNSIDFSAQRLVEEFGSPYEMYTHIQESTDDLTTNVVWIASGMRMPIDEIKEIFNQYNERTEGVAKSKDSFFDEVSQMKGNHEDGMFDVLGQKVYTISRNDFFGNFGLNLPKDANPVADAKRKAENAKKVSKEY